MKVIKALAEASKRYKDYLLSVKKRAQEGDIRNH